MSGQSKGGLYIYDALNYIYQDIWDTQVGTTDDASGKYCLDAVIEGGGSCLRKNNDCSFPIAQMQSPLCYFSLDRSFYSVNSSTIFSDLCPSKYVTFSDPLN